VLSDLAHLWVGGVWGGKVVKPGRVSAMLTATSSSGLPLYDVVAYQAT
jgi:hypothetical protein